MACQRWGPVKAVLLLQLEIWQYVWDVHEPFHGNNKIMKHVNKQTRWSYNQMAGTSIFAKHFKSNGLSPTTHKQLPLQHWIFQNYIVCFLCYTSAMEQRDNWRTIGKYTELRMWTLTIPWYNLLFVHYGVLSCFGISNLSRKCRSQTFMVSYSMISHLNIHTRVLICFMIFIFTSLKGFVNISTVRCKRQINRKLGNFTDTPCHVSAVAVQPRTTII